MSKKKKKEMYKCYNTILTKLCNQMEDNLPIILFIGKKTYISSCSVMVP